MTDYERTTVQRTADTGHVRDPRAEAPIGMPGADPVETWTTRPADLRTSVTREHTTTRLSGAIVMQRVVGLLFGTLQAALLVRIVLLLLVANHDNSIVSGILGITNPFIEPFRGMFSLDRVSAGGGSVLDVAAVVAIIGWTLMEALILALLRLSDRRVAETS